MDHETIFVQTDPAFNVVLESLTELRNQNRLQVIHFQTASLKDIESNDESDDRRFMFGGDLEAHANPAFGETASAVVRMCMLAAVDIRRGLWPSMGPNSQSRNRAKVVQQIVLEPSFRLANNRDTARHYWSKYDQLYPHFLIEEKVREIGINAQARMPSMMIIFRPNFAEVIEITTTFTATPREEQVFHSYIHVICSVRRITEGEDNSFTKQLKFLMQPLHIQDDYFDKMMKMRKKEDLESLPDALGNLEIDDENEQQENPASQ